ncbi:MAG: UDP-N-acetylmuramyl-tripeptide synthetase [Bacilli bacterium]|nr:UDP-N-acetylmuramyl-tripeptide synthetase [Bacilli bacterium]
MKLYDYLKKLNMNISNKVDIDINNVTSDSRKCDENSLYVNINNGYLENAVEKGIKVVVSESYIDSVNIINNVELIIIYVKDIKDFYYQALKTFYNINNGYKIGVTGTCGKTTTVTLLYETLKLKKFNLLLISSNGNSTFIGGIEKFYPTKNTTPDIETIYELINKCNYDYVIIEASSQGIMNNRLKGIVFDMCVFLNLSSDHLDYHKTLSNYLNAKLELFNNLKNNGIGLVNYHNKFKSLFLSDKYDTYTFGINEGDYYISYEKVDFETMKIKLGDKYVLTYLVGDYNAENISAVNAILSLLNINSDSLINCLNDGFIVDGRFNVISYKDNKIIIDFAHTEKEVEKLLNHVFEYKLNKLYIVIGAGGDRDKSKRPVFGYLTTMYSDLVIFTEDNSRSESTIDIVKDMTRDLTKNNYLSILNRYDAIKYGIGLLDKNDILLIIGKGIDKSKCYDRYLSDFEIVKEVINNDF